MSNHNVSSHTSSGNASAETNSGQNIGLNQGVIYQFIVSSIDKISNIFRGNARAVYPDELNELLNKIIELEEVKIKYNTEMNELAHQQLEQQNQLAKDLNAIYHDKSLVQKQFYEEYISHMRVSLDANLKMKELEIQAQWDLYNSPFRISKREFEDYLQRHSGFIVFYSHPEITSDANCFEGSIKKEIEEGLVSINKKYYQLDVETMPVTLFRDFKRPLESAESERIATSVNLPALIINSVIADQYVYVTLTSNLFTEHKSKTPLQRTFQLDWEQIVKEIETKSSTPKETLRISRKMISEVYSLTMTYFTDLYFLSVNPFFFPLLPQILPEFSRNIQMWIKPCLDSLEEFKKKRMMDTLQSYLYEQKKLGNITHAISACNKLIEISPEESKYYYTLGTLLEKQEQADRHWDVHNVYYCGFFLDRFQVNSQNYRFVGKLAVSFKWKAQMGDSSCQSLFRQRALYCYYEIIRLSNESSEVQTFLKRKKVWQQIGEILLKSTRLKGAMISFDNEVSINPNNHSAWIKKSEAALLLGSLQETFRCFFKILVHHPSKYEALTHIIRKMPSIFTIIKDRLVQSSGNTVDKA
ncbi:hypothetical protein HC928_18805 [bacterium]|nr:hypothetical protein [bacterium]